jgi:hypothetical protein
MRYRTKRSEQATPPTGTQPQRTHYPFPEDGVEELDTNRRRMNLARKGYSTNYRRGGSDEVSKTVRAFKSGMPKKGREMSPDAIERRVKR